ncbi:MAG: tetratricopeptide repeat protein [Chloroflexota bacterium]|nr:tetratricopeptide repeat protein [Chloroflexota bacterium]MDE2907654.1 tetratricopeptide repeat protein [Chloroflexota bacterium]
MAQISLSAYQNELDSLLGEQRYDEAIAHARHILKSQPKNLRAYQQLGDALLARGRWEEAGDLLRRALGAKPQDFHTHLQLARAYQNQEAYDRAIWHAERALDQKSGDQESIALVRELYRDHRQEEIDRLQLTAAALAQQQIRGNLLSEALDTLAAALEESPQRIDLQLLQARALWLDGRRMDAAETALDILDRLPYAIDANRIMTELWLAEQRPSDAQLYLKRIEALDPYLAHQMASGEEAPETLLMLERLDYSARPQRESELVNPEWLDKLGAARDETAEADEGAGGLGALLGIDEGEAAPQERAVTDGLDDLLSNEQIEALFSELVIGEPVAAVSEAPQDGDDAEALLNSMEERGFLGAAAPAPAAKDEGPRLADHNDVVEFVAQARAAADDAETKGSEDMRAEMDGDLADLLERLDSSEDEGGWMADIHSGSLALEAEDEPLEYLDDFEREWVKAGQNEEAGGAPWLSAAMREAIDKKDAGELDLFDGDEQMNRLLNLDSDTEPLHMSDIEDWLSPEADGAVQADSEPTLDIDDELLHSPPGSSWLEDDAAASVESLLNDAEPEDPNQLNADLVEDWGAELGDDDDDDPYVDWLRDDPKELGHDELASLSVSADDEAAPFSADASAVERARAWGLDDVDQLADFVEDAGGDQGAPGWLNAVAPGLDRENDSATDDVNEYARPMSAPGKEFAWVSDLVQEETGEMKAIDPDDSTETPYFRFSNPPAWLRAMQERSGGGPAPLTGAVALSLDEHIDALDLEDLTFDDYFNFDTPTDKLDAISLDEDTQQLSIASLDWDDYFELESPTEKTIAITLDEDAEELNFDTLGVDDADFDFESKTDETLDAGADIDFNDIGLGDDLIADADQAAEAPPAWLNYDGLPGSGADDDDANRNRRGGQTAL